MSFATGSLGSQDRHSPCCIRGPVLLAEEECTLPRHVATGPYSTTVNMACEQEQEQEQDQEQEQEQGKEQEWQRAQEQEREHKQEHEHEQEQER